MKEFERWFDEIEKPRQQRGEIIYIDDCKQAWHAALEWIRGMSWDNRLHHAGIKIWDEIDNELDEK